MCTQNNRQGLGNTELELSEPITCGEDVKILQEDLETNEEMTDVVILNFRLFDKPE